MTSSQISIHPNLNHSLPIHHRLDHLSIHPHFPQLTSTLTVILHFDCNLLAVHFRYHSIVPHYLYFIDLKTFSI